MGHDTPGDDLVHVHRNIMLVASGLAIATTTAAYLWRRSASSGARWAQLALLHEPEVATRAKGLGFRSVPAVAIEGLLAGCCAGRGPDESTLRLAGLGAP